MSRPRRAVSATMFGKRSRSRSSPIRVQSSSTCASPERFISRSMARATMSRAASEPAAWYSVMNGVPSERTSSAPSPRSASVSRKAHPSAGYRAVGWNCTNSRLATGTCARIAMAMPSPVAIAGLVVWR
jgi:hypothetical protein